MTIIIRRTLIILTGLLVVFLIGWFMWSKWPEPTPQPTAPVATDFFPGGEERAGSQPLTNTASSSLAATSTSPETPGGFSPGGRLYPISAGPATNLVLTGGATSSPLLFADRATGNFYLIMGGQPASRLTNTTIAGIREIYAGQAASTSTAATSSASLLIYRTLAENQIETWSASTTLSAANASFTESGEPLSLSPRLAFPGLAQLIISPDGRQLFYLTQDGAGAHGWLTTPAGGPAKEIFRSPAGEWRLGWPAKNIISLQTAAAANLPGALYYLDPSQKAYPVTEIISGLSGLAALASPDGQTVAFSALSGGNLVTGLYSLKTKTFTRLPFTTLAEKCAFNKSGSSLYCAAPRNLGAGLFPDIWYRGETAWEDSVWRVNPLTSEAALVFSPSVAGAEAVKLDAQNLILSADEETLYLINRRDGRPWALSVGGVF